MLRQGVFQGVCTYGMHHTNMLSTGVWRHAHLTALGWILVHYKVLTYAIARFLKEKTQEIRSESFYIFPFWRKHIVPRESVMHLVYTRVCVCVCVCACACMVCILLWSNHDMPELWVFHMKKRCAEQTKQMADSCLGWLALISAMYA